MRFAFLPCIILPLAVLPVNAIAADLDHSARIQPVKDITMIDATRLTVAELMALANAERQNPGPFSCCDWSGGNCMEAQEIFGTAKRATDFALD